MSVPSLVRRTLGSALCCAAALTATAIMAQEPDVDQLRQRIEQLEAADRAKAARIAEMEQQLESQWLTQRQAEEVRALIADVLSDAQTRSSLLAEGVIAGIDEKGTAFLKSADGSWLMKFSGQLQFRYLFNHQDERGDDSESGFQARRVKVQVAGHIADPKITYVVRLANSRSTANTSLEEAKIGYAFDNGVYIQAGKMKLPFTREELNSSRRLVTVERSSVNEYFTLNFAEQMQVGYKADRFRVVGSFSDGANSESSEFNADMADLALTGRVDLRLAGDWSQMKDFTSWRGEDRALFVGGAAHYEVVDGANNPASFDGEYLALTADASYENDGFSVFAAYMHSHFDDDPDAPMPLGSDLTAHGVMVQVAYQVTDQIEPFARYEWLDADDDDEIAIDGTASDPVQIVTVGGNYYLRKHAAKFTADVVYVFAGDAPEPNAFGASAFSSSLGFAGFASAEDEEQLAVRLQFQLLF